MLAGVFGMNLSSGIEDSDSAFGSTVGLIAVAVIVGPMSILWLLQIYAKINLRV
jgi:hypothetical protein